MIFFIMSRSNTYILSWFKKITILILFLSAIFLRATSQNVKIIEFGWDYPDVMELSNGLGSMQNTPFDGICFSLQRKIMEAFDTAVQSDQYFEFEKLNQLHWGKYSSNFIILRGFSKTGGNWFDDYAWENISHNMVNLSKAMKAKNIKGILFDPEYYYENKFFNPWTFSAEQYPGKTLEQVQNKVKQRGEQFIIALQKQQSSFTFISIWIASLIAQEKKYTPLEKTRHVLLISFIEGMLNKKISTVTIADGDEYAYWNKTPSQFLESKNFLKNTLLQLMHSQKAIQQIKNIEIAQPVFYDGLMGVAPSFDKGLKNAAKWKWLNENIKYALASSDQYVWFYSQRINWWKGNINDTLLGILKENKLAIANSNLKPVIHNNMSFSNKVGYNNINSNKGYYHNITGSEKNETAFTFEWNSALKKLSIHFNNTLPLLTYIYLNNKLKTQLSPTSSDTTINVPTFTKGNLIIINKYKSNTESSAIYVLK